MGDCVLEAIILDGALGPAADTTQKDVPQRRLEEPPIHSPYIVKL